jgi:MFS transporter, DHA1 family, multidrug resistance protein
VKSSRNVHWFLYVTLFQVTVGMGIIFPILPSYINSLGANSVHMGLMIMFWAGAHLLCSPFWGSLSDRIGRRPVLLIGLTGHFVSFLMLAVAPNIWIALLGRVLGGMLSAAIQPTAQAYAADLSAPAERSAAIGRVSAAFTMGFVSGPAIGGLLAPLGDRGAMLAAAFIAVINVCVSFFMLPSAKVAVPKPQVEKIPQKSVFQAARIALFGHDRILYAMAFVAAYGQATVMALLGFFLIDRLHSSETIISVAYTGMAIIAVTTQIILVRWLPVIFGDAETLGIGLFLGCAGCVAFMYATTYWHVVAALIGASGSTSLLRTLVASLVSKRARMEQGMALGVLTSFDALGRTVGPPIGGALMLINTSLPYRFILTLFAALLIWVMVAGLRPLGSAQT